MQVKLDSQKKKRQLLEEEVSSGQAHIAELTAILKSAVRSNSVSGQAGPQSPRSATLSHEGSSGEVGPRLRSKELQGESAHCVMSPAGMVACYCSICGCASCSLSCAVSLAQSLLCSLSCAVSLGAVSLVQSLLYSLSWCSLSCAKCSCQLHTVRSVVHDDTCASNTGQRLHVLSSSICVGEAITEYDIFCIAALTQRLQLSVADARSDLERHSSLRSADLKAEFSGSSRRAGQVLASPDTAPNSPSGRRIQAIYGLTNTGEGPGYSSGASTPNSDSQRRRPPGQSHMPAKPMIDSPRAKRPSFSSAAGQQRQAAWQ